jgi:hypothetical protein
VAVATVSAELTVNDGELHATSGGSPLFSFKVNEDAAVEGAGTLCVLVPSSALYLVVTVSMEERTRILRLIGRPSDDEAEAARLFAATHALRRDACQLLAVTLEEHVNSSALSVVRDHCRGEACRIGTQLYAALATLVVPDPDHERAAEVLIKSGFASFLGDDVRIAKVLAAIGLGNTLGSDVSMLCHFAGPRTGVPADRMEMGLRTLRGLRPFPLVFGDEQRVYATV